MRTQKLHHRIRKLFYYHYTATIPIFIFLPRDAIVKRGITTTVIPTQSCIDCMDMTINIIIKLDGVTAMPRGLTRLCHTFLVIISFQLRLRMQYTNVRSENKRLTIYDKRRFE